MPKKAFVIIIWYGIYLSQLLRYVILLEFVSFCIKKWRLKNCLHFLFSIYILPPNITHVLFYKFLENIHPYVSHSFSDHSDKALPI